MDVANSKILLGEDATLSQECAFFKLRTASDVIELHSVSLQNLTLLLACAEKVLDIHIFF
jgi:hypothetical protein